mmetsp:Transcript_9355/g.16113  ORF Transcript_9355/g.16113 Transcript_9355/m.16113 type:complete len:125 (+) Transcript_9355:1442-1816(+)
MHSRDLFTALAQRTVQDEVCPLQQEQKHFLKTTLGQQRIPEDKAEFPKTTQNSRRKSRIPENKAEFLETTLGLMQSWESVLEDDTWPHLKFPKNMRPKVKTRARGHQSDRDLSRRCAGRFDPEV